MEVSGLRGDDRWLPHLLGHEGSGVVEDVGPDVKKFKKGDEVILSWIKGNGIEAQGAIYDSDDAVINSGKVTTFSNYSVVSENRLTKKTLLDISKISPTLYLGADNYITINKKSLLNLKSKSFHKSYLGKKIKIIS